jgi:hypothetical protein
MIAVSRDAWQTLLSQHIATPEFEPPVRRGQRRYGVPLGSWRLLLHDKEDRPVEVRATLLNASLAGVMLLSRRELPENIPVLLAFCDGEQEYVLTGAIVHCTSTVGGHKVGVRLRFPEAPEPQTP